MNWRWAVHDESEEWIQTASKIWNDGNDNAIESLIDIFLGNSFFFFFKRAIISLFESNFFFHLSSKLRVDSGAQYRIDCDYCRSMMINGLIFIVLLLMGLLNFGQAILFCLLRFFIWDLLWEKSSVNGIIIGLKTTNQSMVSTFLWKMDCSTRSYSIGSMTSSEFTNKLHNI